MKDRKEKSRQRLTLCCSMIDVKENKNKKINTEESGGDGDGDGDGDGSGIISSSSTRRDGIFSAIFGEKSKRSSAYLCCSLIQGSSSPPMSPLAPKAQPDDFIGLSPKQGALSGKMLPVEDVKNHEVK